MQQSKTKTPKLTITGVTVVAKIVFKEIGCSIIVWITIPPLRNNRQLMFPKKWLNICSLWKLNNDFISLPSLDCSLTQVGTLTVPILNMHSTFASISLSWRISWTHAASLLKSSGTRLLGTRFIPHGVVTTTYSALRSVYGGPVLLFAIRY